MKTSQVMFVYKLLNPDPVMLPGIPAAQQIKQEFQAVTASWMYTVSLLQL